MKKYLIFFFANIFFFSAYAQNTAINSTGATPDASAMLDVSSTGKGLLIPRMSTANINLIVNPAKGLLVFDSSKNQLVVNSGTSAIPVWQNATAAWNANGNAGTNPSTNFLGTTDNQPLKFRIKNMNAGSIDSASLNTAFGFRSLDSLTTGESLTALGYKALTGNSTGSGNVAIGAGTLRFNKTGDENTGVGTTALNRNISGTDNTGIGFQSLLFNSTGTGNSATGAYSLFSNRTGEFNTAIGGGTLQSNNTGSFNTANGIDALLSNTTGSSNVAMGAEALSYNTTGSFLVAIGDSALLINGQSAAGPLQGMGNTAIGSKSLVNNATGYNNTAVGFHSLFNMFNGNSNTAIGYNAGAVVGALVNTTSIGANAVASQSNSIQLGDAAVTTVSTSGNITVKNGKGIIRGVDGTQQKKLTATIGITATITAGNFLAAPFPFPETFSTAPDVYVGNVISGTGFNDVIMTVSNVTTTGAVINFSNVRNVSVSPNFIIKIIAIGAE